MALRPRCERRRHPDQCRAALRLRFRAPARFRDAFRADRADRAGAYHAALREVAPALAEAVARARQASPLDAFAGRRGFFRQASGPRDVEIFSEMTGDRNLLHTDPVLAARAPFGGLIVRGGVTSGLLNAVVAEDLPGPGSVFLGVEWRFMKAVQVGEEITAEVEVTTVRDDKPVATLRTTVRDARSAACLTGTAVTWTAPLREAGRRSG
ncbi:MaoC/PaaZ C-terminal domain-containing protein [Falsiroseomonas sp. HC035]|uniref:MaoC/PaaZ C-terminal domain-containing protein n=1 Tax=Falsiroseomonas sp. HC035 TaxID=3390999 RepID=UPI003D322034